MNVFLLYASVLLKTPLLVHDLIAHSANIHRFLSLSLLLARLFDTAND